MRYTVTGWHGLTGNAPYEPAMRAAWSDRHNRTLRSAEVIWSAGRPSAATSSSSSLHRRLRSRFAQSAQRAPFVQVDSPAAATSTILAPSLRQHSRSMDPSASRVHGSFGVGRQHSLQPSLLICSRSKQQWPSRASLRRVALLQMEPASG